MAQLYPNGFDANNVDPNFSFEHIPAGKYIARITASEMKTTNAGTGQYLQLEFEVIQGDYTGRKVWARLNLINQNQTAVDIAQRELSAICHAIGKLRIMDSQELHDIPMEIDVKVEIDKKGEREPQNAIKSYKASGSHQASPAPQQQPPAPQQWQQSPPAPQQSATPWQQQAPPLPQAPAPQPIAPQKAVAPSSAPWLRGRK